MDMVTELMKAIEAGTHAEDDLEAVMPGYTPSPKRLTLDLHPISAPAPIRMLKILARRHQLLRLYLSCPSCLPFVFFSGLLFFLPFLHLHSNVIGLKLMELALPSPMAKSIALVLFIDYWSSP